MLAPQFDPGDLRRDVVHAARLLRRSPGVVAVAVAGVGLAIGISTSVFTLINAILLQSGGIAHPASVVRVMRAHENGIGTAWPYSAYAALRTAVPGVRLEA